MSIDTAPTTLRSGLTYPEAARDHLWMHFTRQSTFEPVQAGGLGADVPIIVRGKGHLIYDDHGREYIDGLAGLFVVQVGHGRGELAEAAARQARELAFFPLWSDTHPRAIELVKDKTTRETFNEAESERLLHGFLSKALFDAGLYCRADDRGDPVVQLSPPLTIGRAEFADITSRLRSVLTQAQGML